MNQINTYNVRYSFHIDNTTRNMHATSEGVSLMHAAGMVSAELSDMFDLPRSHWFAVNGTAYAQVGYSDRMYVLLSVEAV